MKDGIGEQTMSKEKQIEEMAKVIVRRSKAFRNQDVAFMTTATKTAESLYNAGYRRQSAVIDEFAERVKKYLYEKPSIFTQQRYIVVAEIDKLVEEMKGGAE